MPGLCMANFSLVDLNKKCLNKVPSELRYLDPPLITYWEFHIIGFVSLSEMLLLNVSLTSYKENMSLPLCSSNMQLGKHWRPISLGISLQATLRKTTEPITICQGFTGSLNTLKGLQYQLAFNSVFF